MSEAMMAGSTNSAAAGPSTGSKREADSNAFEERKVRLEQYKLFVEMAEATSASRSKTNTFYVTLHTALYGAIWGFLVKELKDVKSFDPVLLTLPFYMLGVLCVIWRFNIRSYDQLNSAKFEIVGRLEQKLPEQPWSEEWALLGYGKDRLRYWPVSQLETWIPVAMLVMDLAAVMLILYLRAVT